MEAPSPNGIRSALQRIPSGRFVLTAAHGDERCGVIVDWVQQCSVDPPMVMAALLKGLSIDPLIQNSRAFALCQVARLDQYLARRFRQPVIISGDPFLGTPTRFGETGSPLLERAMSYFDCDLIRHIDTDSDFEIFVGLVRDAAVLTDQPPQILLGGHEVHLNSTDNDDVV